MGKLKPVHPGEILMEEFSLANKSRLGIATVGECMGIENLLGICLGEESVTADSARALGHYFSISADFWLNLQAQYDKSFEDEPSE